MSGSLPDPLGLVKKDSPAPAAAAPAEPKTEVDKAKSEQMALREQEKGRAAVGAGILGSDNEADKLGSTVRRKQASRALLGG